ncbi:hypothetical protein RchiOBHm_Chr5g0033381 [Rosa chinensis]|uniref:Uncharacterized protein n=1 Tax=Rosa chinensis TaxID=74649 RepID=A0A2P6QAQ0_ROSCH|nr:hypothetical protein RchiOBHm_Chr5g0033381 [Rosa chinensis]
MLRSTSSMTATCPTQTETERLLRSAERKPRLLPDPTDLNLGQYMFSDLDLYLDLDYGAVDPKAPTQEEHNNSGTDGVVPVQSKTVQPQSFEMELPTSKPFIYGYHGHCLSQSVSSSSMDVSVVPDGNMLTELLDPYPKSIGNQLMHPAV